MHAPLLSPRIPFLQHPPASRLRPSPSSNAASNVNFTRSGSRRRLSSRLRLHPGGPFPSSTTMTREGAYLRAPARCALPISTTLSRFFCLIRRDGGYCAARTQKRHPPRAASPHETGASSQGSQAHRDAAGAKRWHSWTKPTISVSRQSKPKVLTVPHTRWPRADRRRRRRFPSSPAQTLRIWPTVRSPFAMHFGVQPTAASTCYLPARAASYALSRRSAHSGRNSPPQPPQEGVSLCAANVPRAFFQTFRTASCVGAPAPACARLDAEACSDKTVRTPSVSRLLDIDVGAADGLLTSARPRCLRRGSPGPLALVC
ncbi:hypothetical protein DFH11DRAFT_1614275 [Phellopilus nigrolimitatus]|nr:hypothetical protein DFH11DRAFT_1614275 [Phellopilus nigrolimitatus]